MVVRLECGCLVDDENVSTVHDVTNVRSRGDVERKKHHYPIHVHPAGFCISCDLFRPCICDKQKVAEA